MPKTNNNHQVARETLETCARAGVAEYCVCAGSRNSVLLTTLGRAKGIEKIYSFVDERSAAFFAIGRIQASGRPVAVVTTSGTAAAELLPAAVEAHYQGLPLILVTADRPEEFRGTGAPQTIVQLGLFGTYAQLRGNAEPQLGPVDPAIASPESASWDHRGPLHLNPCFGEPLEPDRSPVLDLAAAPRSPRESSAGVNVEAGENMVVLLGKLDPGVAPGLIPALRSLSAPIWAEAHSNLRGHAQLRDLEIKGGERSLRDGGFRRVLRLGGVPTCRFWRDLEARPEIEVHSISELSFPGLARESKLTVASPASLGIVTGTRNADFHARDKARESQLMELLDAHPKSEPSCVRAISNQLAPDASLFLGNSLPLREWDLAATREKPGIHVFANRGANGIDGNISTFLGAFENAASEAWAIVGDLTAIYDFNAFWILPQLKPIKRRLVIINNGGGGIFRRVTDLADLAAEEKQLMVNPHGLHFEKLAEAWGLSYYRWKAGTPFPTVGEQAAVIEAVPRDNETEKFWQAYARIG